MRRELALVAGGALAGLSWGHAGAAWLIVLAGVMPVLWSRARTRWTAGAIALAYYLAGSRGLPLGAGVFFEASAPAWFGWALWIAVAAVSAALWCALWQRDPGRRVWAGMIVLVLTAIPPIGIIGWTNPLTAAGYAFPGMGFVGLAFFGGFVAAGIYGRWPAVAMFAAAALVANVCAVAWPSAPPAQLASWAGRNTHFPKLQSASVDILGEGQRVLYVLRLADQMTPGQVLVLPETVLPRLSATNTFTASMLADASQQLRAKRSTILVGAERGDSGQPLKNILTVLGEDGAADLVQRVPVPIGMWRPWRNDTVAADLLGGGIGYVAGQKIAYSICYEQLLVYPVLLSMAQSPSVLVGAANDWWARDTSIPAIQAQSLTSWGRLFGLKVVQAVNA